MSNIFISYHRQSEAIARALATDIEALGHAVWFDQELKGGQAWWDHILASVRNCDVFVFLLDTKALDSAACKREYGYAANLGKLILPVLVAEGMSMNLLPPALSQIQFVDYRKQDRDAVLSLVKALNTLPPPKPLPDPMPSPPEIPISFLGRLAEQIETASNLNYELQSALLIDLKRGLRDPETISDARVLLEKLRNRPDIFATIADEIEEAKKIIPGIQRTQPANTKFKVTHLKTKHVLWFSAALGWLIIMLGFSLENDISLLHAVLFGLAIGAPLGAIIGAYMVIAVRLLRIFMRLN